MTANTIIAGAVMFGREKMQPGVLIEPHPEHAVDPKNETSLADFRNKVWYVQAVQLELLETISDLYCSIRLFTGQL